MFLIIFVVFAVIALLGGNLMALFGFRYESTGALLLYFLAGGLIGFPLEVFSTALPQALYDLGQIDRRQANFLYIPLDTLCTMLAFWIADQLMASVSASVLCLGVLGLCMSLTTLPMKRERRDSPQGPGGGEPPV